MNRYLYRVVLPHAVYGVVVDESTGRVTEAAPIGRWAVGKPLDAVKRWVERRGGTVERRGPA